MLHWLVTGIGSGNPAAVIPLFAVATLLFWAYLTAEDLLTKHRIRVGERMRFERALGDVQRRLRSAETAMLEAWWRGDRPA